MGTGSEIPHLLRLMLGSAITPTLMDADPVAAATTGFTGNLTTGPYDMATLRPIPDTQAVIFEGCYPIRAVIGHSETREQFASRFVERTIIRAMRGDKVQLIILTFDFNRHDLKDCEAEERAHARRNTKPGPVELDYLAGGESRRSLMAYLLSYILNKAPLRPGLTIIISGLTHTCAALRQDVVGQMPLCIRLSEDRLSRQMVAPWEVIGLRPDSGRRSVPHDPRQWFTTTYEADDQVRSWLVFMLYYIPPELAASWDQQSSLVHERASPNTLIVSEDTGILIECLAKIAQLYQLAQQHDVRRGRPGALYYTRTMVGGYVPKPGESDLSGRKGNGVDVGQLINMRLAVRILCHVFDPLFAGLGLNTPMALVLLCMLRANDYYVQHAISGTNAYSLLRAMANSHKADILVRGDTRPFVLYHINLRDDTPPSMFDPVSVSIDYSKFAAMMTILMRNSRKSRANEHAASGPPEDAVIRGHASRILLFMVKTLNNDIPGFQCPPATDAHRTPQGHVVPTYGFIKVQRDADTMAAPSATTGPVSTTICTPVARMPTDPENPQRCLDGRTVYSSQPQVIEWK